MECPITFGRGYWKGLRKPMLTGKMELYDLGQDPTEANNVAERHPEIVARIEAIMKREHRPSESWRPPAAKKKDE